MRGKLVAGAGFALALAAAVAVTTEPAGAAFSAPIDLSDSPQDVLQPEIASDADGDAVAVWSGWDGSNLRVKARTISAGGSLGPIRTLSDAGQHGWDAQVASDSNGGAIVVWYRNAEIQARTISAAGDLGSVETLSTHSGDGPQIASDADGDAIVVWRRHGSIYARAISAAGVVGPSKILSRHGQFSGQFPSPPQIATDAQGDAVAVWIHDLGTPPSPTSSRVEARTISRTGVRGPIQTLAAGGGRVYWADPQIASDARGDAVAVWIGGPDGVPWLVKARMISHTGSLGPIRTLTGRARNRHRGPQTGEAQIAIDADGDAVAVWRGKSYRRIQARTISSAGSLGPLRTLSSGSYHGQYQVASDADGDAVAVWSRRSPKFHVYARAISAAGALGPTTTLSADGLDDNFWDPAPEIASDADGSVVAVWRQFEQLDDQVIQASQGP